MAYNMFIIAIIVIGKKETKASNRVADKAYIKYINMILNTIIAIFAMQMIARLAGAWYAGTENYKITQNIWLGLLVPMLISITALSVVYHKGNRRH